MPLGGSTEYSVTVSMSRESYEECVESGLKLYLFRAVQAPGPGRPLIWRKTTDYGQYTTIRWCNTFTVYTSRQPVPEYGEGIDNYIPVPVDLGNRLVITSESGTGDLKHGQTPRGVEAENKMDQKFSWGLADPNASDSGMLYCFPLFGNSTTPLAPVDKVLLTWWQADLRPGVYISSVFGRAGLLVDLDATSSREVGYDINNGWQAPGAWASVQPEGTTTQSILIDTEAIGAARRGGFANIGSHPSNRAA